MLVDLTAGQFLEFQCNDRHYDLSALGMIRADPISTLPCMRPRYVERVRKPRSASQSARRRCQVVAQGFGFGTRRMPKPWPPVA